MQGRKKGIWKLFKEWALFMPLIIVSSPVNTLLWLLPGQPSCPKCTMSATVDGLCFYGDANLPKSTLNSEPSCFVFHSRGWVGRRGCKAAIVTSELGRHGDGIDPVMAKKQTNKKKNFGHAVSYSVFFFRSSSPSIFVVRHVVLYANPSVFTSHLCLYVLFRCNKNRRCEFPVDSSFNCLSLGLKMLLPCCISLVTR